MAVHLSLPSRVICVVGLRKGVGFRHFFRGIGLRKTLASEGIELPPVLSFPLTDPARLPQAALQHDVAAHQQLRLHIRLTVPLPSDVGKTVATATTMSCWSTASCDGRFRNTLARHVFFKIELPTERSNFGQVTCGRALAHVKCVRTCSATNLGLNERINHSEPS